MNNTTKIKKQRSKKYTPQKNGEKMTWIDTLQKKGSRSMSKHAIGLIRYVLTSEPQTGKEILEAMFEKSKEYVDSKNSPKGYVTSHNRNRVPTRNELKYWLARQSDVESARFDKWTNKVVPITTSKPNTVIKYWRAM